MSNLNGKDKRIVYCILLIGISFILFLFLKLTNESLIYQTWLTVFALTVLLTFVLNLIFLHCRGYRLVSFFTIFVALLYLFHFGQVILYGIFPTYKTSGYNFIAKGGQSVVDALLFSYVIINFIILGGLLVKKRSTSNVRLVSKKNYKLLALIFICISLPLQLYIVVKQLIVSHTEGYNEVLHLGLSGALTQIANFYIIGFVMLLIIYKNNLMKKNVIFVLEVSFLLVSMLSGSRIYAMTSLLVLIIVYFYISKTRLYSKLIWCILLLIIMQFVVAIAKVREVVGVDIILIIKTMFDLNNNAILAVLDEFGSSIVSVYTTIEQVPSSMNYSFGITYLKSLAGVFINIPGVDVYGFVDSACYIKQLSGTLSYGGSLIGELYFNFGFILSLPVSFLIGYVSGCIDRKAEVSILNDFNLDLLLLIMVMYTHFIWVRGYFSNIIRAVAWSAIIIYLFYSIVKSKSVRKEATKCKHV